MSNFLHGLGGGIGRGIGRFIAVLIIAFLIYLVVNLLDVDIKNDVLSRVLMLNVSAKQQSTTSFTITTPYAGDCTGGQGGYCATQTNGSAATRQKGTTYNGVLGMISFDIHYVMNNAYQYTLNIYAMSTDFRNNDLSILACGYNSNYNSCIDLNISYSMVSKNQITINFPIQTYQNYTIKIMGNPLTGVSTYGIKKLELVYDDGSTDMSGVIDNQNQNTTDIINNNNSNTQDIINKMIDLSYPSCDDGPRYFLIGADKSYLANSSGQVNKNTSYWISQPIKITGGKAYELNIVNATNIQYGYYCFYNNLNERISCTKFTDNSTTSYTFTAPSNAVYFRTTLYRSNQVFLNAYLKGRTCVPDTYENNVTDFQNLIATNKIGDSIDDDSVDQSQANSFFNDFQDDDHGLSSIVTLPLTTIQSLTSNQCFSLELPVPFTNGHFTLPCMSEIYQSKVPALYNLWQTVCYGLIGYWIATDIFKLVKGFKDPEQDKVEVMDL